MRRLIYAVGSSPFRILDLHRPILRKLKAYVQESYTTKSSKMDEETAFVSKSHLESGFTTIIIPDVFQSFVVSDPPVFPGYERIRKDSESWIGW
jgi:hypothetical protein